jgi:hypothetical protein
VCSELIEGEHTVLLASLPLDRSCHLVDIHADHLGDEVRQ